MIGSAFPQKIVWRAFCVLASFLLAGSVQAEWSQLGRTDTFRLYLDQKLIQKSGDFVQVWQLMDFTVAQWADARTAVGSIKNLIEYDCAQPRLRTLAAEAYTEQMGAGRLVANERLSDPLWENVAPGSTAEQIRKIACGKK
jgi:hypothetical protein